MSLLKSGWGAIKGTASGMRNIPFSIAMSTGIGAGIGYAQSDGSGTQQAGAAFKGALIGGLGMGAARAAWAGTTLKGMASFAGQTAFNAPGMAYRGIKTGVKTGTRGSLFALNNPGKIAAAGVGVLGFGMLTSNSSPTESGARVQANYNQQAITAENMQSSTLSPMGQIGSAPQMMGERQRRLTDSTNGLVQGLHRGRHS